MKLNISDAYALGWSPRERIIVECILIAEFPV